MPAPATLTLTLRSMRFFGRHGVYAEETARGQPFEATVSLVMAAPGPGGSDRLGDTVDYTAAAAVVRSIMEGPPVALVETLAESVAAALLSTFPAVLEVRLEILKPEPRVDFDFDGVSVTLVRARPLP